MKLGRLIIDNASECMYVRIHALYKLITYKHCTIS